MNWQDFLNTQTISDNISADTPRLYPVTHLSVLTISGSDAATFLQGQITCNVHDVTENLSRFGAICTPKGRVISTFILVRSNDDFLMILPTELLPVIKERLQKYVLRAKVQLNQADLCVLGVSAAEAEFLNTKQENDVVRVHLGQRDLLICNTENAQTVWHDYLNQGFQATTFEQWRYLDILAGLPWLTLDTAEQFIPQMLNLDALGGISYEKGCYTGQEIVARTHYLGKAKRALFLAESTVTPDTNTDILNADGQTVGTVLMAENHKMLIVLQEDATTALQLNHYNEPIILLTVEVS